MQAVGRVEGSGRYDEGCRAGQWEEGDDGGNQLACASKSNWDSKVCGRGGGRVKPGGGGDLLTLLTRQGEQERFVARPLDSSW